MYGLMLAVAGRREPPGIQRCAFAAGVLLHARAVVWQTLLLATRRVDNRCRGFSACRWSRLGRKIFALGAVTRCVATLWDDLLKVLSGNVAGVKRTNDSETGVSMRMGDSGESIAGDGNRAGSDGSSNGCPPNQEVFCRAVDPRSESRTSTATVTSTPGSGTHTVDADLDAREPNS
jgi:hypothetical protein